MDFARLQRALTQRMFLLKATRGVDYAGQAEWAFTVEGASGTPYKVVLSHGRHSCACMDFRLRRQPCKHIAFITVRVLRTAKPHLYMSEELDVMLTKRFTEATGGAAEDQKAAAAAAAANVNLNDDPCPVCYEEFTEADRVKISVCGTCKKAVHNECLERWLKSAPRMGAQSACFYCRTPWPQAQVNEMGVIGASFTFGHTLDAPPIEPKKKPKAKAKAAAAAAEPAAAAAAAEAAPPAKKARTSASPAPKAKAKAKAKAAEPKSEPAAKKAPKAAAKAAPKAKAAAAAAPKAKAASKAKANAAPAPAPARRSSRGKA